jgi:L-fucose mutarotase
MIAGKLPNMLKGTLIHPQILEALGSAGHTARIVLSDGNFPHSVKRGPNAKMVYLNLAPGLLGVCDILRTLITAVPIEAAAVMDTEKTGPYVLPRDPEIWDEFATILQPTDCKGELKKLPKPEFYSSASAPDVCLTIATGEQKIYANLLLTIGVVR